MAVRSGSLLLLTLLLASSSAAQKSSDGKREEERWWSLGVEGKIHYRDSALARFPSPFPFPPELIPAGQDRVWLETPDPGSSLEVSQLTLYLKARWGERIMARAKIDFIDLYDRNPTSGDQRVDVDELWVRFGEEVLPATLADGWGAYLKAGKFGKFERQNDRHLESYGLVSTAFNRFEDSGLELGVDIGRHFYGKGSVSQGNPVFFRDPNALAGDNGTDELLLTPPQPKLGSGLPIIYDAEVEDFGWGEDPELGAGLGFRYESPRGVVSSDFLVWAYRRDLADTVALTGTFYGGDLDLLLGPGNAHPLPVSGRKKQEVGGNLWIYAGGFTFFGQYVDQELAGMPRIGYEAELAWKADLPLRWSAGGYQLFPYVAPAFRYSKLDPDFGGGASTYPAPSVRWEWEKYDFGLRIGLVQGLDLTLEDAEHYFVVLGKTERTREFLMTLRFRR